MNNIWYVLGLAMLPAFGNVGGGMLAEFTGVPKQWLSRALHAASGIVIAIVAVSN